MRRTQLPWTSLDRRAPLAKDDGPRRKGAARIADIPPAVRRRLDRGEIETTTLVEWLAIDHVVLVAVAARAAGLEGEADRLAERAEARASARFTDRMRGTALDLGAALAEAKVGADALAALALHPSDMIRGWLCSIHGAAARSSLEARLATARFFAADRSMAVRECAWDAIRPHLVADLDRSIASLEAWVVDADPNVRRCAIEATRPRGVWCPHIEALKLEPERGLPLVSAVRDDESRYVLASAANWLNDASKSRPDWVASICAAWSKETTSERTEWLVRRALRTIERDGPKRPVKSPVERPARRSVKRRGSGS
jgi:3-methyladenine DNA glycosylase AlkC